MVMGDKIDDIVDAPPLIDIAICIVVLLDVVVIVDGDRSGFKYLEPCFKELAVYDEKLLCSVLALRALSVGEENACPFIDRMQNRTHFEMLIRRFMLDK